MKKISFFKSIKFKFTIIFIGLFSLLLVLAILVNSFFLEKIYFDSKCKTLRNAYLSIEKTSEEDAFGSDEFDNNISNICDTYDISVYIIDVQSQTRYASSNGGVSLESRLLLNIFGMDNSPKDIIEEGDNYVLQKVDLRGRSFVEMMGRLENGISFIMSSPLESISESARIANRFYILSGLMVLIIGTLIIYLVSKKLTKPILELDYISERMVSLDFEARAEVKKSFKRMDEIDVLASNINELSNSLEKSISELKAANIQLQQDIKTKEINEEKRSEFISAVSHELKTPISIIRGYSEGLRDGIADNPDSLSFYCDVIIDESEKMSRMVKQLINLDELESGREQVVIERFDLKSLVDNCINTSEILYKPQNINVINKIENSFFIWADIIHAEEIFMNYFTNACHYCEGEKIIEIKAEKTEGKIKLSVFNTGNQIPEESINLIWDKFYKVDKARTRTYGGSGVGLSIVKAICEANKMDYGAINFTNGVQFFVTFESA